MNIEAMCIGCGCTASAACVDPETGTGCHWLAVDAFEDLGVCSGCPGHLQRFIAGDRELAKEEAA